jgi:CRP/FNR family transcriptional regulator, cyclic AMP receptor protein
MGSQFAELQSDVEQLGTVSDFVNEFIDAVKSQPAFDGFSRQETSMLSEYMECYGVPRESVVLREGDEGDFLAILVTGKAHIIKSHGSPAETTIRTLEVGSLIGEMSLVDGQRRFASCVTTEPSDFAVLTRDNLNAILTDHPRLGNKFLLMLLKLSTHRLREATSVIQPGQVDVSL